MKCLKEKGRENCNQLLTEAAKEVAVRGWEMNLEIEAAAGEGLVTS